MGFICFLVTSHPSSAGAAEVVDRIVAVVNDEIIVLQEINTEVDTYLQSNQQQIEAAGYTEEQMRRIRADLRESIINSLVDQRLVIQAAKENEYIDVSEEEIDAKIQKLKEKNNFTDEQFLEFLAQQGLTVEEYRTKRKEAALSENIIYFDVTSKIVVTKADVTRYYNEHPEKYQGKTTYHVRNIQVKAPTSDSPAAKTAVQDKLANIFAELEAGQSFQDVARKYSESATASDGGEFSDKLETNGLQANFRTAIEALSPGEYTQALETSDGYQIFYVQEINKESDVSLESVYSDIENELYNQQYQEKIEAWIKGLRENAHIKILE